MTNDWKAEAERLLRRHALQNAVEHAGQANPKAVVGKVLAEAAALRPHARELGAMADAIVAEINALPAAQQQEALKSAGGPARLVKRARGGPLKPLPNAERHSTLVMRFAPNPNGPATLGHSRGMCTLSAYRRIYEAEGRKVRLVLRYDDTDPQIKPPLPEAYAMILDDWKWLGETPDVVVRASGRLPVYYQAAEELLRRGGAYICFCSKEAYKPHRDKGTACPHRESRPEDNLASWQDMLEGRYKEGDAVLRVKTQADHPDPALRDWVGFRVATTPHPIAGTKWRVWPMLDFESAVEDHEQGVTHIIRGKDLIDSTRRQVFLYQHLEWTYPETLYWGRVRLHEHGKFSSSGIARDIAAGRYAGWDDIRLPTLQAYRRRGFHPDAITNFWLGLGLTEKDVAASVTNLEAENRKVVEPHAPRLFFVPEPIEVPVEADQPMRSAAPVHPDRPEMGTRKATLEPGQPVALPRLDWDRIDPGATIRLKDLANFEVTPGKKGLRYAGNDLALVQRGVPILQWCIPGVALPARLHRPTDPITIDPGLVEPDAASLIGRMVQFERVGFARLEKAGPEGIDAVFAHR